MNRKVLLVGMILFGIAAQAEIVSFGAGGNQFSMEFVAIENTGNADDTVAANDGNHYGGVAYRYSIGKYLVTIDQFSKALAANASIAGGNENYWNDGTRTLGPNAPAVRISFAEAAKFCNWLTSGAVLNGAYTISNGLVTAVNREAALTVYGKVYVLPTEDEWYKAAYYTTSGYSLYANGTTNPPVAGVDAAFSGTAPWPVGSGTIEQNGTYDMMGNVWEWSEGTPVAGSHLTLGGGYANSPVTGRAFFHGTSIADTTDTNAQTGMRIVAISTRKLSLVVFSSAN